jgi:hypothetical protein
MRKKIYYCPADDFTCPYYNRETGICELDNPDDACEEFFDPMDDWGDPIEEEPDDFPD